ncbi:hypothetical protein [Pseudomonas fluorescens]|uniref:Uncharacterized protein n=1 Tax=Pseudomonas fluorescens TaxID=294 RepID=A0A0D0PAN8_PSEFL|nr:hypothetical protein [Pseudomonas fluorescens]KIQ57767.1 hypothetical protein RL74_19235 [Pseudomonas fluorescens]
MSKHAIAIRMIESRFALLNAGDTSAAVHAEASMAIELAHSLGVIDLAEYGSYRARLDRIYELQSQYALDRIRASARSSHDHANP